MLVGDHNSAANDIYIFTESCSIMGSYREHFSKWGVLVFLKVHNGTCATETTHILNIKWFHFE